MSSSRFMPRLDISWFPLSAARRLASMGKALPIESGPEPPPPGWNGDRPEYTAPGKLAEDPDLGKFCGRPPFPTGEGNGSLSNPPGEGKDKPPGTGKGSFDGEKGLLPDPDDGNLLLLGKGNADPPKLGPDPVGDGNPEFDPNPLGTGNGSLAGGRAPLNVGGALNELVPVL